MSSFRLFNRQARRLGVIVAMLVATVVPALTPAFVSAETITERSIALSSSTKAAPGVGYEVKFNAQHASTGAFIIDFCTTAAIGATCTTPSGLNVGTPTTTGTDTVSATDTNTVKVVLTNPVDDDDPVDVVLGGLTNPSAAGAIYARILTYADSTAAGTHDSETANMGSPYDNGAVALTITDGFSVGGSVLESLIFCATDNASTIGTGCSGTLGAPNVVLGSNGILTTAPSEGTVKTQISTNAASGAVVSLKNSTPGGGLKRAEAASSDIAPFFNAGVPAADIGTGTAKFGLKLANLNGGTAASGLYSASNFFLDYAANNATGVTSAYGSPVYNTGDAPINDGTANLTFAANISNLTPAGSYSAALNLIATGKF